MLQYDDSFKARLKLPRKQKQFDSQTASDIPLKARFDPPLQSYTESAKLLQVRIRNEWNHCFRLLIKNKDFNDMVKRELTEHNWT